MREEGSDVLVRDLEAYVCAVACVLGSDDCTVVALAGTHIGGTDEYCFLYRFILLVTVDVVE